MTRVFTRDGTFAFVSLTSTDKAGKKTTTTCLGECESIDDGNLLRNRSNSLSNSGFVLVGVWIAVVACFDAWRVLVEVEGEGEGGDEGDETEEGDDGDDGGDDGEKAGQEQEPYLIGSMDGVLIQVTMSAGCVYAGVGSFLWHASLTKGCE